MRSLLAIALTVVLLAPLALVAQGTGTTIQMRPDEAFWNAIRNQGDAAALRLFIATYPDSPYRAEAEKRLAAGGGEVSAPAAEPDQPEPVPGPALHEVIAALQRLGLDPLKGETGPPDPARLQDYLEDYRFFAKIDRDLPVSDVELNQLIYLSNHAEAWTDAGYDHYVIGEVLFRLRSDYTALKQSAPPDDLAELVVVLQGDIGQPVTGDLDSELLAYVAFGPAAYEFTPRDIDTVFGDWLHVPSRLSTTTCFLVLRDDKISWAGPYLTAYRPGAPLFVFDAKDDPSFRVSWTSGDLFRADAPLTLSADGQEVTIDQGWELGEPVVKDGKSGEVLALLRNARGPVTLSGISGFGMGLDLTFSGSGFDAGLRKMNDTCADGKLDGWLR